MAIRAWIPDVREEGDAGYVADRPVALGCPAAVVDRDPVSPHRDAADRLQAEVVHAGTAAGGDDECLAAHLAAVVELETRAGPSRRTRVA